MENIHTQHDSAHLWDPHTPKFGASKFPMKFLAWFAPKVDWLAIICTKTKPLIHKAHVHTYWVLAKANVCQNMVIGQLGTTLLGERNVLIQFWPSRYNTSLKANDRYSWPCFTAAASTLPCCHWKPNLKAVIRVPCTEDLTAAMHWKFGSHHALNLVHVKLPKKFYLHPATTWDIFGNSVYFPV